MDQVTPKLTWDMDECAEKIGVSRRTLSRYVRDKKIPFVHMGSRVLFRPAAIEEWLTRNEVRKL